MSEERAWTATPNQTNLCGQPPPASFISKTMKGFPGHEEDGEVGLVNAKAASSSAGLSTLLGRDGQSNLCIRRGVTAACRSSWLEGDQRGLRPEGGRGRGGETAPRRRFPCCCCGAGAGGEATAPRCNSKRLSFR